MPGAATAGGGTRLPRLPCLPRPSGSRRSGSAKYGKLTHAAGDSALARSAKLDQASRQGARTILGRTCSPAGQTTEYAPLAQSAERLHGKEKVYGSIP